MKPGLIQHILPRSELIRASEYTSKQYRLTIYFVIAGIVVLSAIATMGTIASAQINWPYLSVTLSCVLLFVAMLGVIRVSKVSLPILLNSIVFFSYLGIAGGCITLGDAWPINTIWLPILPITLGLLGLEVSALGWAIASVIITWIAAFLQINTLVQDDLLILTATSGATLSLLMLIGTFSRMQSQIKAESALAIRKHEVLMRMMSHDITNPLTVIFAGGAFIDKLIREKDLGPEIRSANSNLNKASSIIAEQIKQTNDIDYLGRAAHHGRSLNFCEADQIIRNIKKQFDLPWTERNSASQKIIINSDLNPAKAIILPLIKEVLKTHPHKIFEAKIEVDDYDRFIKVTIYLKSQEVDLESKDLEPTIEWLAASSNMREIGGFFSFTNFKKIKFAYQATIDFYLPSAPWWYLN